MFEQLSKKIGRIHRATADVVDRQPAPPGLKVFDYSCSSDLDADHAPLKVLQVNYIVDQNSSAHHTDMFEATKARSASDPLPRLIVRRGQPFIIKISFDREFSSETDEVSLIFQFGEKSTVSKGSKIIVNISKGLKPHNWSAGIVKREEKTLTMKILTPPDSIVGKCSLIVDTMKSLSKKKDAGDEINIDAANNRNTVLRYLHDDPMYVIFNPWLKDDQVYVKDERILEECVLSDYGQLHVGNYKQIIAVPWRFAQFERIVLDCCVYLLDATHLEHTARGNAAIVVRNVAMMINSSDDSGILLANWSGNYKNGGMAPMQWVGSLSILEQFWKTKLPVGYGQCWVFSALATTVCRCLGIPTRCVTNFSSAHDCDGTNTMNMHWNFNGEPIVSMNSDSIWSFHVWNESYMMRSDLPGSEAGWQAFDPTPQEASDGVYCAGPCSVEAIKRGDIFLRFDGALIFSELNTNRFHWVLREDGSWRTILQKNITGKSVVTHKFSEGSDRRLNSPVSYEVITDQYKFVAGTEEERAALLRANTWATNTGVFDKGDGDVRITLNQDLEVEAGASFNVLMQLQNQSRYERNIKISLTLLSTYYTGLTKWKVKSQSFNVTLCALKSEQISMRVLGEDYAYYMTDVATFRICAFAYVDETEQLFVDAADFCLTCPKLEIEVPQSIRVGVPFDCVIKMATQMPVDLTDCEWMIEALGVIQGNKVSQTNLEPYARVQLKFRLTPHRAGKTFIMASFNSKQLMGVNGNIEINVTD